jgi:hypothetical protein
VFCARDDFILYHFAHTGKVGAVTGHPYNQVSVFFRILLGVYERGLINYIKLNVLAAEFKIGAD